MFIYKFKITLSNTILKIKSSIYKNKIIYRTICFIILFISVVFFARHPLLYASIRIDQRIAVHRFNIAAHRFDNMPRENMINDFEHLMTVLEENWPFFNLSISANGVDVRELAEDMRLLLHDPSTPIDNPLDFLDLLHEHFFSPIGQLGHLSMIRNHEAFFDARSTVNWQMQNGFTSRFNKYYYELYTRPESVMFYRRLRDTGRNVPAQVSLRPAMEFDILEAESTAYIRINRMMQILEDIPSPIDSSMTHYEKRMLDFTQDIQGFDHLIIDLRGNRGGRTTHFDTFIMPHLLPSSIQLHAYVFYMDGVYANLAREMFDATHRFILDRSFGINEMHLHNIKRETHYIEPLPYLDENIGLSYMFNSVYRINSWHHRFGVRHQAMNTSHFNGKMWLLTDEFTASAAEGAAAILKYNNIVTVVGEPTWGVMGVSYEPVIFNISLPNTGIIVRFDVAYYTDPYGRPLQGYGIQPHYPNRPGMDALETVLAMIEEGRE